MDEKGIKKIIEIITTIIKLSSKGTLKTQGLNDRLGVAKEIYQRNISDNDFMKELNLKITKDMSPIFEIIVEEK